MRIGIITLFDNGNAGAALQAYALNTVLRRMGHACVDIRYERVSEGQSDTQANWKKRRKMLRTPKGWIRFATKATLSILLMRKLKRRRCAVSAFVHQYIPQTQQTYRGMEALEDARLTFDAFICGSDNIWNKLKFDPAYLLAFVPDEVPKYSYAAGLSAKSFSPSDQQRFLPLINRLKAISVRDHIGVQLLRSLIDQPIREDVDPTLLLTREEWSSIAKKPCELPERYIFCYLLGNGADARQAARKMKQATGLPIVNIPHATSVQTQDVGFGDIRLYDVGPAEMLYLFAKASYVITDSFHGCIFSLIFEKQFAILRRFVSGPEVELNMRLDGLLDKVGLLTHMCENAEETVRALKIEIDFQPVRQKICALRNESFEYLKNITREVPEQ